MMLFDKKIPTGLDLICCALCGWLLVDWSLVAPLSRRFCRHGHLRPPVKLQTLRHPGIKPFLTNNLSANNDTKMVNLKDSTVFDYIRYVGSAALLLFSTVVTFYAILEQKTSFWKACRACSMILHDA